MIFRCSACVGLFLTWLVSTLVALPLAAQTSTPLPPPPSDPPELQEEQPPDGDTSSNSDDREVLGEKIVELSFEGLRRVDEETLRQVMKSVIDTVLDPEIVTEDLRQIWATGYFSDVRIEVEDLSGGVGLIVVLSERPSIRAIEFMGRDAISEDDVDEVVDIRRNTILNVEQIKRNVTKIRELYVEKGYYLADVGYRLREIPENPSQVDLVFDIVENAKVVIRQLTFVGNQNIESERIKSVIRTREGNELSFISGTGTYNEEFLDTDLLLIQFLYMDEGYIAVKVGEPSATISSDRRFIYLTIPITEGDQYTLGKISFTGEVALTDDEDGNQVSEEFLRAVTTLQEGETFNRTAFQENIERITDVYRNVGYAFANVIPREKLDRENRIVDFEFDIERGPLVDFGRIEIVGNSRTRDKVIRREMAISEGDRYSARGIEFSRARILQTGFFEDVNITTESGVDPDVLDVTVEVQERSTRNFQVGAGFSSIQNFIANVAITDNNFLGNGQSLSLQAQLSFGDFGRQIATLSFFEPYFLDSIWSLGINAYIRQVFLLDFQRNARGFSPSLGYPITREIRFTAGYTLEEVEVIPRNNAFTFARLNRRGLSSAPSLALSYDTRDNRLFPSRGSFLQFRAEFSNTLFGSDASLEYNRYDLNLRKYYPLGFLGMILRGRANFGLVTTNVPEGVPISERFFPGGVFTVRGFRPRALGPSREVVNVLEPNSPTRPFIIGGNKQVILNLELQIPIVKSAGINAVLFADAGNAFDDSEGFFYLNTPDGVAPSAFLIGSGREIDPPLGLFYSVGFGFRWVSPIGPLRFEWGIPITKRQRNDDSTLFEFNIGEFF